LPSTTQGMTVSGEAAMRGMPTDEALRKMALGTTVNQLVREVYNEKVPKEFADKLLSEKLSKLSTKEISAELSATSISKERKQEILNMLPDRVRQQVIEQSKHQPYYAPVRGYPQALYTQFSRKKIVKKKAKAKKEATSRDLTQYIHQITGV